MTLGSILNTNLFTHRSATVDPAIEELNRIVDQAESLLRSLGEQGGEAAEAVARTRHADSAAGQGAARGNRQ